MKIAVYGAASNSIDSIYLESVEELGRKIALNGHSLVFGGGSTGLMGAAARGVHEMNGFILGIAPTFFKSVDGALYEHCNEIIYTDSMRERKFLLEEHADAFIITPGGVGTFEEFFEAFTLKQLGLHHKPMIIYNINGYYNTMKLMIEEAIEKKFMSESNKELVIFLDTIEEIFEYLNNYKIDSSKDYRFV